MNAPNYSEFQDVVWDYYRQHARAMPWRLPEADGTFDPYKIMISEIMLQQTQVSRVIPKYQQFIATFPTVEALARAPLSAVLGEWNGLGYNRRAKFIHLAAKQITSNVKTSFPTTLNTLSNLPGIGVHTAGAIMNYTYNQPTPFLETNIRTVFIYHFYAAHPERVSDKELLPLVETTMDHENPREWFWALMDYGSHLKATVGNLSRQSKHYTRQSKFEGSVRQIRGQVLRELLVQPGQTKAALKRSIPDQRLTEVLIILQHEELISSRSNRLYLNDT